MARVRLRLRPLGGPPGPVSGGDGPDRERRRSELYGRGQVPEALPARKELDGFPLPLLIKAGPFLDGLCQRPAEPAAASMDRAQIFGQLRIALSIQPA